MEKREVLVQYGLVEEEWGKSYQGKVTIDTLEFECSFTLKKAPDQWEEKDLLTLDQLCIEIKHYDHVVCSGSGGDIRKNNPGEVSGFPFVIGFLPYIHFLYDRPLAGGDAFDAFLAHIAPYRGTDTSTPLEYSQGGIERKSYVKDRYTIMLTLAALEKLRQSELQRPLFPVHL